MTKFTSAEIEKLTNEVIYLLEKANSDTSVELDSSCNNIKKIFQGTNLGTNECERIHGLNTLVHEVQDETIEVCNEIKALIANAEIITD